jgi:predicted secreted Zn-dependent protease
MWKLGTFLVIASVWTFSAQAGQVEVTSHTRTYRVSGDTIQAVVRSMKRNGPNSELHGRRALGMADYRYRTRVRTKSKNGRCHVEDASVTMRISYILPRLSKPDRLPRSHLNRWRKVRAMIERHENQHGRYYRRFANDLHRSLRAISPQRNCAAVRALEKKIKTRLENISIQRNRRYDRGQYRPFNRRLKLLAPKRR